MLSIRPEKQVFQIMCFENRKFILFSWMPNLTLDACFPVTE